MYNYYTRRVPSTKNNGQSFSLTEVDRVWAKAIIDTAYNPNLYRRDTCGALIKRSDYGNTNSSMGWEIDHVKPVAKGGGDELFNLQPLQWQNNRSKSDDYPNFVCKVRY